MVLVSGCKSLPDLNSGSVPTGFRNEAPGLPGWVTDPHCDPAMLCAVGSGPYDQYARKDAYKALAESVSVEVNSLDKLTSIQDGDFIRQSQALFLSVKVSDVKLTQAAVVRQDRFNNTSYVLLQLAKEDLKLQLRQQLKALAGEIHEALKDNPAKSFDDWWELRQYLSDIRIITRNVDMLENLGEPRNLAADELGEDYFKRLYDSFLARQISIEQKGVVADDRLMSILSQQFKAQGIEIVETSLISSDSRLEVLIDYDNWRAGQEQRVAGNLWLRLKSRNGQTLAEYNLQEIGISYRSVAEARQLALDKLIKQLRQVDSVAQLIN